MTTVLITGSTGFVGGQIIRFLMKRDVSLILVVRSGKESAFKDIPNVKRVVRSKDLFHEEIAWWEEQCKLVDIVIHAAWYVEPNKYLQSSRNEHCLNGSIKLAQGAVNAGVKRVIGVGTCFEYDLSGGLLTVNSPLRPTTPYSIAKVALFEYLKTFLRTKSTQFAWCRLFYLYGENEDERRLVPYIHRQLKKGDAVELTTGQQVRDFMDVSVAGRIIAEISLGDKCGPINVCSGVPITVRQLAERIADNYGARGLLKFGARLANTIDPPYVVGVPNHGVSEGGV
ncbi:NAD(P)-dependent oxidoreductase [Luminiphilus sp.]|nr:NAD(P)-dependent oxidoreductase [Luminiphilus sp.]